MSQLLTRNQKKTIGEASIDSRLIYGAIKNLNFGEIITYQEISDLIGRDILKNRSLLQTARNMAMRFDNIVFDCVLKIGLKRLNDSEITEMSSTKPFLHIRSYISSASKKISCIDKEKLNNEERLKMYSTISIFGVLKEISTPSSVIKLQKITTNSELPVAKTVDYFFK
jgi:hypothetical protein